MTVETVGNDKLVANPSTRSRASVTDDHIHRILIELAKIDLKLTRVEELAEETNGRVTRLEAFRHRLEGSRAAIRVVEPMLAGIVVAIAAFTMERWG